MLHRRALLISSFALAQACVPLEDPAPVTQAEPIIGGVPSTSADYPSAGALLVVGSIMGMQFGSMDCTGTLIAPDVVLTAAHCTIDIFGMFGAMTDFYFTFTLDVSEFGMSTMTLPPQTTHVKRLVPHPNYNINTQPPDGLGQSDDVGLLFLDDEVTGVTPEIVADANDGAFIVAGSTVAIAGYGQTSPNSMTAGVKYHALTIVNEVGTHEMQIGDLPPRPQKCHGDSGGPTYLDVADGRLPAQRVIGITSRAYDASDCNKGGVDTRADAYRDWIEMQMIAACGDGTRGMNPCAGGGGLAVAGGTAIDAGMRDSGMGAPDASEPDSDVMDAAEVHDSGVVVDAGSADAVAASDAASADRGSGGGGGGGGGGRDSGGCSCSTAGSADPIVGDASRAIDGPAEHRASGDGRSRDGLPSSAAWLLSALLLLAFRRRA